MASRKLIQHLISVKNKSGAIPSAPSGLEKLKEAIEGVPFSVNVPGMSAVMDMANMVQGIVDLVQDLGSLSAVGEFKNVLGRVQSQLGGVSDITQVSPERLTEAIKGAVSESELAQVVGQVTALTSSLRRYGG